MRWFTGIGDLHGLDSLVEEPLYKLLVGSKAPDFPGHFQLHLRARMNRHRHSVAFRASFDNENSEELLKLWKEGAYIEALLFIKREAEEIQVERHFEKSWHLIPQPHLDPYRS